MYICLCACMYLIENKTKYLLLYWKLEFKNVFQRTVERHFICTEWYMYKWKILNSCIRTSGNISRDGERKASALFSQLASLVDRCRVEWKTYLKGSTLSIKKIAWDFQRSVSFHGSCPEKAKKDSILCAKNFKDRLWILFCNCSPCLSTVLVQHPQRIKKYVILKNEFYFRPNLFDFLAVLHGKPVQQLHLYARKVDGNGARGCSSMR